MLLSRAGSYPLLLAAAALVGHGLGRAAPGVLARRAHGGRQQPGLAQSLFQIGGNLGSSIGPLFAAVVVLRYGQGASRGSRSRRSSAWCCCSRRPLVHGARHGAHARAGAARSASGRCRARRVTGALAILVALMFSKFVYTASMTSYYTFYLIERFERLGAQRAALSVRVPRVGRVRHAWPAGRSATGSAASSSSGSRSSACCRSRSRCRTRTCSGPACLSVPIGMILASAFPAIVVYGQELMPFRRSGRWQGCSSASRSGSAASAPR